MDAAALLERGALCLIFLACCAWAENLSVDAPPLKVCNDTWFYYSYKMSCTGWSGAFNVTVEPTYTTSVLIDLFPGALSKNYQSSIAVYIVDWPQVPYGYTFSMRLLADGFEVNSVDYTNTGYSVMPDGVKGCRPDPTQNWQLFIMNQNSAYFDDQSFNLGIYAGDNAPGIGFSDCPLWIDANWWVVIILDGALLAVVVVAYLVYMFIKKKRLKNEYEYARVAM